MKQYIGTKVLLAQPMTRGDYNTYRGWPAPADEDQTTEGYLVEYQDGGKSNDARHAGYISWSPKDVFELAYVPTGYETRWNLPPHQQRVLAERAELESRRNKLGVFIKESPVFQTLPAEERERLVRQESCMSEYSSILGERIRAFMPGEESVPTRDVDGDGICTRCGAMFEDEVEIEDHLNGPMCEEMKIEEAVPVAVLGSGGRIAVPVTTEG